MAFYFDGKQIVDSVTREVWAYRTKQGTWGDPHGGTFDRDDLERFERWFLEGVREKLGSWKRAELLAWLEWYDPEGMYRDDDLVRDSLDPYSKEEAIEAVMEAVEETGQTPEEMRKLSSRDPRTSRPRRSRRARGARRAKRGSLARRSSGTSQLRSRARGARSAAPRGQKRSPAGTRRRDLARPADAEHRASRARAHAADVLSDFHAKPSLKTLHAVIDAYEVAADAFEAAGKTADADEMQERAAGFIRVLQQRHQHPHRGTVKLSTGEEVLAKPWESKRSNLEASLYQGTLSAKTFANRKQAETAAAKLGAGWEVIQRGRPWFVRRVARDSSRRPSRSRTRVTKSGRRYRAAR